MKVAYDLMEKILSKNVTLHYFKLVFQKVPWGAYPWTTLDWIFPPPFVLAFQICSELKMYKRNRLTSLTSLWPYNS